MVTGGHREEAIDIVFDGERWSSSPARAIPTALPTARAARTPRCWPRGWRCGDDLEAAAREAKRVASQAVRDGLRGIGAGAGPVDVLGLARAG